MRLFLIDSLNKLIFDPTTAREMNLAVNFRPINQEDEPFLYQVYASTREEELKVVPWSEQEKVAFLKMQFEAQHKYYQEQYSKAKYWVIERQNKPIGRLYLDYRTDEVRIIDIAILSEHRNQGIGSQILRDILAEAEKRNLPVRIHVEQYNSALNLYLRLGFKKIGDIGVYFLMEWQPNSSSQF